MSIKTRLSLIIVLIGFILFLISGFVLWTQTQGSKQDQFSDAIVGALQAGDETGKYALRLQAELAGIFRKETLPAESLLEENLLLVSRSLDKWILSMQALARLNVGIGAADAEKIENLKWMFAEISVAIEDLTASLQHGRLQDAASVFEENVEPELSEFLSSRIPDALSSIKFMIGNAYYENFAQSSSLWKHALLILAVISLVILLVTYRLLSDILRSLHVLNTGAKVIGRGNLEHKIGLASRDELGQLASSFNSMMFNLKRTTISRDYVDNIIRSMIGSLIVTTPDRVIKTVNSETCNMLGYEEEELIGMRVDEIFADGDHFLQSGFEDFLTRGEVSYIETRYLTKNKTEVPVVFSGSIMRDESGAMQDIVFVAADISAQKEAEKRQAELLKELDAVNKELKDFAYIVSHDLKAPLRAIHSLASWISKDYAGKLDQEGQEQLALLRGRVTRMQSLIDGILHYSRVGRIQEEKKPVDLNELVKGVADALAPPDHISIRLEGQLPVVLCDKVRMEQVFQNLIGNAVKYMDKEKGEISVACIEKDDAWQFSVSDNGPGIEEKDYEKIFQIFQKLQPRDEIEGTGIGLSVVKKIIELNGGKIWVESEIGKGSRFLFTITRPGNEIKEVQP